MELQNVSIAFISRFHFYYSPHSIERKWCLFAIEKITNAIFATPTKQFLLADEEFSSKAHITQQHGNTEREYCVYLTFSFSLFTSLNRQGVMFVCHSKDNKSYLRDTNETILASRWRVFMKKTQITEQHGITERIAFISRFHFHYSPNSTERKWCLFAIQKITKAIFATPTKQFLLADEKFPSKKTQITEQQWITERENWVYLRFAFSLFTSFDRQEVKFVCDSKDNKSYLRDTNETFLAADEEFSWKNQINKQHGITEREYCVYLTFSFSLSTSFNRQEVKFVCDSKDNKSYLRDTNKTIFASRWRVLFKNPHISAAW